MILASLVVEREPLKWADLPNVLKFWVQDVGAFALAALLLIFLFRLVRRFAGTPGPAAEQRGKGWQDRLFLLAAILGVILYAAGGAMAMNAGQVEILNRTVRGLPPTFNLTHQQRWASWLLFSGGAVCLGALLLPFFLDAPRWRWRRVWALARLSFKEAIRRKILWVFASLTLLFLFYAWFQDTKPEYQVRNYVTTVYWVMTPLLLVTASFVAAFGLPADIRQQTIHTIVTKPVERFEIILGRFLGYTGLLSLVLIAMTAFSLLYLMREIDPEARRESVHARVPLYADLLFFPGTKQERGESVGDEFTYRGYIMGGISSPQRAVWHFHEVPAALAQRTDVPCEFSFAIFRTHKGEEARGVLCTFTFVTWRFDPARENERQLAKEDPRAQAEKYGIYQVRSLDITNFHTMSIPVPGELFKNALQPDPERLAQYREAGRPTPPPLQVTVKCDSNKQLIGAARHDLYLLEGDRPFALNFFKGAVGLWFRLCVVVGLAVALSTYLNGIISWLTTWFLYLGGVFLPFVQEVAAGVNFGGGPIQSLLHLGKGLTPSSAPQDTPAARLGQGVDTVFRVFLSRFMKLFPDVSAFDLKDHVAQGFDISVAQLLVDVLQMSVYLAPFALLAYYLLRSREVANPT
jgi:hypothetical protein